MSLPTTLAGRLIHNAQTAPDQCAVATMHESVSYAELAERVMVLAESLERPRPTNASDGAPCVVGISCEEDLSHLILCLALAQQSATSCTVPTHESPEQRQGFLQRAGVHSRSCFGLPWARNSSDAFPTID
ncbi:MAG: acyl-CoA synthetase (AMP-forming)/AMP-acid ligase II [Planctomycetota bacterium]|jgi:acyl-CoA synthetase (AMP-forming)/AMP-acid ligase II